MLSKVEARVIACKVRDALPMQMRQRLKGIEVVPRLNEERLTIRVFFIPISAPDPETHNFEAHTL